MRQGKGDAGLQLGPDCRIDIWITVAQVDAEQAVDEIQIFLTIYVGKSGPFCTLGV